MLANVAVKISCQRKPKRKGLFNKSPRAKSTQPTFTCSKSTMETPEQCPKSVPS